MLGLVNWSKGQSIFCKTVPLNQTVHLDTLVVHPSSIQYDTTQGSATFDIVSGEITVVGEGDSIRVCYQTLPSVFGTPIRHKSLTSYDSVNLIRYNPLLSKTETRQELFSSPGISKTGSLSRGISVGNAQNVFVNSALNLRLEGQLANDVFLEAAITDQQVPFQPEGNTQQIQEFDRIYLTLRAPQTTLTAGDLVLKNQEGYYLQFQRNLQGGAGQYDWKDSSGHRSVLGAGISKGKFGTNTLQAREGVQGPYKLTGPNAERFILVLANSERVYVDGKRMKRGWDFDYVIDYNRAEITFTNRVLITQFTRLRVDFEFADRNYARGTFFALHRQKFNKGYLSGSLYQERDNRNNPLAYDLSVADQIALSEIGDQSNEAFVLAIDTVGFSESEILYTADTVLEAGESKVIYIYTTSGEGPFLRVSFADVGVGNGDYERSDLVANGQVYAYVGEGAGCFVPARLVATPQLKRMSVVNAGVEIKNWEVFGELAITEEDQNLFSALDDEDNQGVATRIGIKSNLGDFVKRHGGQGMLSLFYDYNTANFRRIDRFRYVEFDRDWSANSLLNTTNHLAGVLFDWKRGTRFVKLETSGRAKKDDVAGVQGKGNIRWDVGHWDVRGNGFLLLVDRQQDTAISRWNRWKLEMQNKKGKWQPLIGYEQDHNVISKSSGEVLSTAMYFDQFKLGLERPDSGRFAYSGNYAYRQDQDTLNGSLGLRTRAHTAISVLDIQSSQHQLRLEGTWRQVEQVRLRETTTNIMGRMDWKARFFKRLVRNDVSISASNGRELKREFIFLEVPFGEGTHVHVDENEDGQQQLDEFVEDALAGNFVRAFVPTDEFVDAFFNQLQWNVNARLPKQWSSSPRSWKKVLERFSVLNNLSWQQRVTESSVVNRFNPFFDLSQETLLSRQSNWRSTLFFNRGYPVLGGDVSYSRQSRKQLLSGGFDSTGVQGVRGNVRLNLSKSFATKWNVLFQTRANSSDLLQRNNFQIQSREVLPEVSWQPSNVFRLSLEVGWKDRRDKLSRVSANLSEWGANWRWSAVSKRSVNGRISFIQVHHSGSDEFASTVVGYNMLEGLSEGSNWKWSLNWRQQLATGLQLNLNYEARKPNERAVIHVGRVQVTALF